MQVLLPSDRVRCAYVTRGRLALPGQNFVIKQNEKNILRWTR